MAPVSQIDLLELGSITLLATGKMLKSHVFDFAKKEMDYLLQFIGIYPSKSLEDIKRFKYAKTYWKEDFGEACKEAEEILNKAWKTRKPLEILSAYGKCLKVTTSGIVKFCNRYPYLTSTVLSTVTIALAATLFVFAPFSGLVIPAASIGSLVIPSISLGTAAFAGGVGISLKFIRKAIFGDPKEHDISKTLEKNQLATEENLIKLLDTKHQIQKNLDELYKKTPELKKAEGLANSLAQIALNMQNKLKKNIQLTVNPLELLTLGLKEEQIHKLAKLDIDQQQLKEFIGLAKELRELHSQGLPSRYSNADLTQLQTNITTKCTSEENKKIIVDLKKTEEQYKKILTEIPDHSLNNRFGSSIRAYEQLKSDLKKIRINNPWSSQDSLAEKDRRFILNEIRQFEQNTLETDPLFSTTLKIAQHPIAKKLGLSGLDKAQQKRPSAIITPDENRKIQEEQRQREQQDKQWEEYERKRRIETMSQSRGK